MRPGELIHRAAPRLRKSDDMTPNDQPLAAGGSLKSGDWEGARALMKRVIAANLRGRVDADEMEDLVQEACVGLMRAVERGVVGSFEAMAVTIAKRTAIDRMRRRQWTEPLDGDPGLHDPAPDDDWLSIEDAQLFMREIMKSLGDSCRDLFDQWLATLNLRAVAERLGINHATARKRAERCRSEALKICLADDGPLGNWARAAMEGA